MILPRDQWCIQVEVALGVCNRACANCTRLMGHIPAHRRRFATLDEIDRAFAAVATWPEFRPTDYRGRRRVVGVMGGEPLLHPRFAELVDLAVERIPDRRHRGLWTGLDWRSHKHRAHVERLLGPNPTCDVRPVEPGACGFINENRHDPPAYHQPILAAIGELIPDPALRRSYVARCWVQADWASAITPAGFFACEVAAAFDWALGGPGGFPLDGEPWLADAAACAEQLARYCDHCGAAAPLPGRLDRDRLDDATPGNVERLRQAGSPGLDRIVEVDPAGYRPEASPAWRPGQYLRRRP